jgi:serine/threonine protein phosphatase PrpC
LSRLQPIKSRKRKQSGDDSLNGHDEEKIEHYTRDHTSCSRCLGDFHMKRARPCLPETIIVERDTQLDEFLVLGCDGIFDIFENEPLRDLIRVRAASNVDLLMRDVHMWRAGDCVLNFPPLDWGH